MKVEDCRECESYWKLYRPYQSPQYFCRASITNRGTPRRLFYVRQCPKARALEESEETINE